MEGPPHTLLECVLRRGQVLHSQGFVSEQVLFGFSDFQCVTFAFIKNNKTLYMSPLEEHARYPRQFSYPRPANAETIISRMGIEDAIFGAIDSTSCTLCYLIADLA